MPTILKTTMSDDSRDEALKRAAALLNYRNRSSQMLYLKLLEKEIAEEDARYAVDRLSELGYLNDDEFASSAVRACIRKGWGKERIRQKLEEYKLSPEIIERELAEYEPDEEALYALFVKLCKDSGDRKERDKAAAKLKRRGFSWNEINRAVRRALEENEEY